MSSFIVNDKTLSRILSFLSNWDFVGDSNLRQRFIDIGFKTDEENFEFKEFGQKIRILNDKAFCLNYGQDFSLEKVNEFNFKFEDCNLIQAFMHVSCLMYQLSIEEIANDELFKLIQDLEDSMANAIALKQAKELKCEWEAK